MLFSGLRMQETNHEAIVAHTERCVGQCAAGFSFEISVHTDE